MKNTIADSFDEIMLSSHFWNWAPDWLVVQEVYVKFPNSFSVLTPFAYSYLEELIRSNTSEYGVEIYNENGKPKKRSVGMDLIKIAIRENKQKKPELVSLLQEIKIYYYDSKRSDEVTIDTVLFMDICTHDSGVKNHLKSLFMILPGCQSMLGSND